MRRLAGAAAAALTLLLAGCSSEPIVGTVMEKRIDPGYDFVTFIPIYSSQCSSNGTSTTCRQVQTGSIPYWMHQPTCYQVKVRQSEGETKGDVRSTCVSETDYASIEVGDSYNGEPSKPEPRKVREATDEEADQARD